LKEKDKKHWEVPGGKVKFIDAWKTKKRHFKKCRAIREVKEEVNLKTKI
jgi:ADP-ribose pyrophosphatase YjhB (NUDIX family)